MSRYADVTELIAERAADPAERMALEATAARVARALERPVPYRPEFRAELRSDLLQAARRLRRPWYRRMTVLGPSVAAAAAVAALALGLHLWQAPSVPAPEQIVQQTPRPEAPGLGLEAPETGDTAPPSQEPYLVALPSDLPTADLADEPQSALTPALMAPVAAAPTEGVQLKRLTARPSEADFRAMARRLGFRGQSRRTAQGWVVAEDDRTLSMTTDGTVRYEDLSESPDGPPVSEQAAGQAARRFLDQALLPVHSQPDIRTDADGYTVVYTEHVDGRPVVNARTEIGVDLSGTVVRATAYVASGVTTHATYTDYVTEQEALSLAEERGGSFQRGDLVWVRSVAEETVYLQPVWRVLGTDAEGTPVARYVPALKP
ncbi:MAG: hypothetical protein AB2385_01390 [Symbiobacterium sp.]|uniref:hypothetical protein n=1 Tax=Symbiobacterium sp. TaxID=1971213 RepID=UPI003463C673